MAPFVVASLLETFNIKRVTPECTNVQTRIELSARFAAAVLLLEWLQRVGVPLVGNA